MGSDSNLALPVLGENQKLPPPLLETISPTRGAAAGGTAVVIRGQGFDGDSIEVRFGTELAQEVMGIGDHVILVVTPAGQPGSTVDVSVTVDGNSHALTGGFTYLSSQEAEPHNTSGMNDTAQNAEEIPVNGDFWAYIGALDDIDFFYFTVPEDGVATVEIDFTESYQAYGIFEMTQILYVNEANPFKLVGVGVSNYTRDETVLHIERSLYASEGQYLLKLTSTPGMEGWPPYGFDTQRPYRIHVRFSPGPGLEADQPVVQGFQAGPADTWRQAVEILFDQGSYGTAEINTFSWYDLDIDWYRFTSQQPGWLRVTMSVVGFDPNPNDIGALLYGSLLVEEPSWASIGSSMTVGDSPNAPLDIQEFNNIEANKTYFFRTLPMHFAQVKVPYKIRFEYNTGGVEDGEPSDANPGDDPSDAIDMGTLDIAGEASVFQAYIYHYQDWDWYLLRTPAGGAGMLCLTWNYETTYQAFGWQDDDENPYGIDYMMYLFPSPFDSFSDFLTYVHVEDVASQSISWNAEADTVYYVMLRSMDGMDLQNPYQFSARFLAGASSCP